MRLLPFILFLFVIDIYFYLGTLSIVNKYFNNNIVYKLLYWIFSILIYIGLIYVADNLSKLTPSLRSNNVIYTSLFFVIFLSKLIGS